MHNAVIYTFPPRPKPSLLASVRFEAAAHSLDGA
jgi:hypothetical protein